jgi:hypothetical protein
MEGHPEDGLSQPAVSSQVGPEGKQQEMGPQEKAGNIGDQPQCQSGRRPHLHLLLPYLLPELPVGSMEQGATLGPVS